MPEPVSELIAKALSQDKILKALPLNDPGWPAAAAELQGIRQQIADIRNALIQSLR